MGSIQALIDTHDPQHLRTLTHQSPLFCPDVQASSAMVTLLDKTKQEGDSLGGIVEFMALSVPAGLGDPVYEKLEAKLGHAMMSLPATKGFEIGSGFGAASMTGSDHKIYFARSQMLCERKQIMLGGL